MSLPFPINPNQTDAKSPIDQQLMDALRLNQEYLETQIGAGGGGGGTVYEFKVNGLLLKTGANDNPDFGRRIDSAFVPTAVQLSRARMFLDDGAYSGTLRADVHFNKTLNHGIEKIEHQYKANTQAVARAGSSVVTQAVARATVQIATQQIIRPTASHNIKSIVPFDNGTMLVTFTGTVLLDGENLAGDLFEIGGADNAANDGVFPVVAVNYDEIPSVLLENGSAVLQEAANGTGQLWLFEYTMTGVVDDDFAVGETALFAGHTDANNDGQIEVYKINQGGNNIWVKPTNVLAATQGGVAGVVDTNRFEYTYSAAVSVDYAVGEKVEMTGHTSGANNGKFEILKINDGANNIIIHNEAGVVQAGPAGASDLLRWVYAMPTDPTTQFVLTDKVKFVSHTNVLNDGTFEVVELNRDLNNNVVVFNEDGIAQVGIAGETRHGNKIITFLEDKAADFLVDFSIVALEGVANEDDNNEFPVVEINRGTVLDFNIVIDAPDVLEQLASAGRVAFEKQSVFTTPVSLTFADQKLRNLEIDTGAILRAVTIPLDSRLTMDLLEVPEDGLAAGLTITVE